MSDLEKLNAFKAELAELLTKHKANLTIMMGSGSDTHGIYDVGVGVCLSSDGSRWGEEYRLSDDYGLEVSDLTEEQ